MKTIIGTVGLTLFLLSGCSRTTPIPPTSEVMMQEDTTKLEKTDSMENTETTAMMQKSDAAQIAFTSEPDAQALVDKGPVVYFFKASWCPTCQALQKELDQNINLLPKGTTIVTVDYDNSTSLKSKYGITYQHTLVQIDASGKELAKWQGGGVSEIAKKIIQ